MQNRFAIAIFVIGILECVVLLLIALSTTPENAAGLAHADFAGMRIGGDGMARFLPVADYAFVFQALVLVQCYCLIALGVSHDRKDAPFLGWLAGCLALALLVWWQIFDAYRDFLDSGETTYFAGFPVATAWQVYGIWLAGVGLVLLYVIGFRRFIWSIDDERAFAALVTEYSEKPPEDKG